MVLLGWRLLINRSPGRLVGVGKASDVGCLPTCFRQTGVVAAGAELVHRQGVEVDVWSRDESPTRLGTASSRHCTKKKQKKQNREKLCSPQALSKKTDVDVFCIRRLLFCFASIFRKKKNEKV